MRYVINLYKSNLLYIISWEFCTNIYIYIQIGYLIMIDIQIVLHPCEVQQFDQLLLPDLPSYVPGVLNPILTGF